MRGTGGCVGEGDEGEGLEGVKEKNVLMCMVLHTFY